MIVTIVHAVVKPEFVSAFIEATRHNHLASVNESGNFRFDILQDQNDRTKFVLYEAYRTDEDIARHRETEHYQKWRDTVAPWMAQPRTSLRHSMLFPQS